MKRSNLDLVIDPVDLEVVYHELLKDKEILERVEVECI